ncbi:MAG: phosphoribosylamine--glycine ligase [Halanaerobiaceae bacterium]
MKVLVVGSGGREHTIVWKLYQSEKVDKIYVAPGNDGMIELAERVNIEDNEIDKLADWVEENNIDLTVVGPEGPLVEGIVDKFEKRGLKIFGPNQKAAMVEGSKVIAKNILHKHNIPTAEYEVFTDSDRAINYLEKIEYPVVIKAEGLAAGKGVKIATNKNEAKEEVNKLMEDRVFGDAGERVVIEDFLEGEEVSILCLTDGENIIPLEPSQDHKAAFDGDEGPNTGGMGAYSPTPFISKKMEKEICENILKPTITAFQKEGIDYKGILYAGLILTSGGPKVLEFNARLGDPEAQVILPRLENDLVDLIDKVFTKEVDEIDLEWDDRAAMCVVLASGGYPITYETGFEIEGLDALKQYDNLLLFHSGTRLQDGKYVTDGGRVLGLTVLGNDLNDAYNQVYDYIDEVYFKDMHYRTDIGETAINEKGDINE